MQHTKGLVIREHRCLDWGQEEGPMRWPNYYEPYKCREINWQLWECDYIISFDLVDKLVSRTQSSLPLLILFIFSLKSILLNFELPPQTLISVAHTNRQ